MINANGKFPTGHKRGDKIEIAIYDSRTDGVQIGICGNGASSLRGLQVTAFWNSSYRDASGAQIAGVVNSSEDLSGVQLSAVNIARDTEGLQIGLINVARELTGVQIGVINIAYGNALPFFPGINIGF